MPSRPWFRMPAFSFAGTGLAGALAGVALTVLVMAGGQRTDSAVIQAVLDSHIRSLQADHLTDVLTSDQHTVKPWLSARLDVSPPVLDLKDAGVPAGRRAAGLHRWSSRRRWWCTGTPST